MGNKKGFATMGIIAFLLIAFLITILLGVYVFYFNWINTALSQDIDVGQVNLGNVTNQSFSKINTGFRSSADTLGVILVIGMAVSLLFNAYFTKDKSPSIFMIVDLFIIVASFIVAVYIAQAHQILANATPDLDVFINVIPKTSKFILNLPKIVAVLGVLIMIISYGLREREQGDTNVQGY